MKSKYAKLDLSLSDYKIMFEPFRDKGISIFHCGNYGDVIASPTFDSTFEYSLGINPDKITIITNGSARTANWWKELALKGKERLRVVFSIDGLEDTNHIYRIGSNWQRIIENAKAFIGAGGRARWDFIEFKHNYHQADEARDLARKMGFEAFNFKYTARFATEGVKEKAGLSGYKIEDLESNHNQKDHRKIEKTYGSFDDYIQSTEIDCKFRKERKLFVDMTLRVWPCCWLGAPLYFTHRTSQTDDLQKIEKQYGADFNSLRVHGWSVLDHEFFKTHLEGSWDDPKGKYSRISTCGRTCGGKFEFSSGHGRNRKIQCLKNEEGMAH